MTPAEFLHAARVPASLEPQRFGPWTIERRPYPRTRAGREHYILLWRQSRRRSEIPGEDPLVLEEPACVMEDSPIELAKHLPIWLRARGRVLVTGLGLGCVVRGLLASRDVTAIDVVEIDPAIVDVVGREFEPAFPRVQLHQGDALALELPGSWDYAWHDLWTDGAEHLQVLHSKLFLRFAGRARWQGAWEFPRYLRKLAKRNGRRIL